jgi:hypothetical protein
VNSEDIYWFSSKKGAGLASTPSGHKCWPSEVRGLWQPSCPCCTGSCYVYAPLTLYGSKIDERALYILGCGSPSCGTNPARQVLTGADCSLCLTYDLYGGKSQCHSPWCGVLFFLVILNSWRTIRFQKEVAHDETLFIDQTDSTGGSSASSGQPNGLSDVLHRHRYQTDRRN